MLHWRTIAVYVLYSGSRVEGSGRKGSLLGQQRGRLAVVELVADGADEAHVRVDRREVAAAAEDQGLGEGGLEDVVGLLGDAVLVRLARLDAGRRRAVVVEHGGEAAIELAAAAGDLVRRGREVVAAPDGGTPPIAARASCRPRTSASNVSENASPTQRHLLKLSTNWNSRCANTWPAMVTPSSVASVKSNAPSRPASCRCSNITSFPGPCRARHSCMRRCSVRSCPARTRRRAVCAARRGPSSPPARRRSSAVEQRHDLGVPDRRERVGPRAPAARLLRLARQRPLLPGVRAALAHSGRRCGRRHRLSLCHFLLSNLTCASVTIGAPGAPGPPGAPGRSLARAVRTAADLQK